MDFVGLLCGLTSDNQVAFTGSYRVNGGTGKFSTAQGAGSITYDSPVGGHDVLVSLTGSLHR
jgi:hypothetical protein